MVLHWVQQTFSLIHMSIGMDMKVCELILLLITVLAVDFETPAGSSTLLFFFHFLGQRWQKKIASWHFKV
jgi:hypothetical protein